MSSLPPGPPPSQPPSSAQPPSEPPSQELLDARGGTSLGAEPRSGKGGRKGLLVGGGVVALALAGGGAWAAMSFLATGDQPAEALPAGALGYVSIDLDPSGGQKIEALQTLNKFPAFESSVGIDPEDDLRATLFELLQEEGTCADLDFADDIDPWLGDRAAVAAVTDADGEVQPVVVVQVDDAGAAETGLETLAACGAGDGASDESAEWVVEGDWAVVAPVAGLAQSVVDDAAESSLADDESFQRWTGETGEPGIVTMYAAPGAGTAILEQMGDDLESVPDDARNQLGEFAGAAGTVRFADGALEVSFVGATPAASDGVVGDSVVGDQVTNLPDDTAVALGLSFREGWFGTVLDQFASSFGAALGETSSTDDLIAELEAASGLRLPEDVEALTGDGVVLSVGSDFDAEELANSADPTQVPIAFKLGGDPDEITEVIERVTAQIPGGMELADVTVEGDTVVVGPDAAYREQVAAGGDLGGTEEFARVVEDGDAPVVFYVNVNSFEDTLETLLSGSGDEVLENVTPLSSLGISTSQDADVTRFVMRVGTDD